MVFWLGGPKQSLQFNKNFKFLNSFELSIGLI